MKMRETLHIPWTTIPGIDRQGSKKRDLSDTSKTDEDPKKIREASSASFADECDVFNEGIDLSS